MSNIVSMFRAIEFIEDNLKEEITVTAIAEAVSYSLYHFCRVFSQVIHHSPYDYLMRRRLSESARELIETDRKITEIAFDYQFNSPETYSRAFKRMFNTQPTQWKKQGQIDKRCLMSRLTLAHLQHLNQGNFLKPVLVEKEAFHLAGVMTLLKNDPQVISELWHILQQELESIKNTVKPCQYYGLSWYPQNWETCGRFYMAAIEITSPDISGDLPVAKIMPASTYAKFIHKGSSKDLSLTQDYIYQTWLPKSGRSLAYPLEIEAYGPDLGCFEDDQGEREIYLPIKSSSN